MPIPQRVIDNPRVNLRLDRAAARASVINIIPDVTDIELDAAISTIDQDAIYDAERSGWMVEVWDRESPINGVPASVVLERRSDIPEEGDIYLVINNGQVVMFQPHEPDLEGITPVPIGSGEARGTEQAELIVANKVSNEIAQKVLEHIQTARNPA